MLKSKYALNGMVVAPHHLAAQAGAQILKQGGNAIEAAIATAASIAVVYPHMNSIGGDGFWLIHEPGNRPVAIQACGYAAALAKKEYYREQGCHEIPARGGLAALTVAGAVGGWAEALKESEKWEGKKLPLGLLLENAVEHAQRGVAISESQQRLTQEKWSELGKISGFAEIYAPKGVCRQGDILIQTKLAQTLKHLAEAGLDDFYRGDLARTLARGLEASGSPLRLSDLENYYAKRVSALSANLSKGRFYNHPPPTQGISSLMILALYDLFDIPEVNCFEHLHTLIEATKISFALRNKHIEDPKDINIDYHSWLEKKSLEKMAQTIDPYKAKPWPYQQEAGDTVWLGAVDSSGRCVSYIQSIFWEFGSGQVIAETGVLWQNRGVSFSLNPGVRQLRPGAYPFHTLNPAVAHFKDGRVVSYGTMGGEGQPQTQAAIISRYADYGIDLQESITSPRWLLGKNWGEDSTNLKIESGFKEEVLSALERAGHEIEIVPRFSDMMGHAGAIVLHPNGLIEGAADPRSDGAVAAV